MCSSDLYTPNGGLRRTPSLVSLLFFALTVLVCVGFRTEKAALSLATVFGVSNAWMYPFWSSPHHLTDFYKYYFFHTLSIIGGLLLLAAHGPGAISVDESSRKKRL